MFTILATLYIITAAALFGALMYDMRRDLRLWAPPTALMFATGLAVLCALWPLVAIIALIAAACTRRKGGTNVND